MESGRRLSHKPSRVPARDRAVWTIVRGSVGTLSLAVVWLSNIAPGKFRNYWLRAIRKNLGGLEQALRYLLLLMRAPAAAPKPAPFISAASPTEPCGHPKAPRGSARFSLTLQKFSWVKPGTALQRSFPSAYGQVAISPREDIAAALQRRIAAMRAVFTDPSAYAARITAAVLARGLRLRMPRPAFPQPELWSIFNKLSHAFPATTPAIRLDSS